MNLDRALYKAINSFADHTAWGHGPMRFYAKDGIAVFAVLLLAGWWIGRRSTSPIEHVSKAVWAGAGPLVALALNQPIGRAVARARPYTTIPNMHLLVDRTKDFSFASDHATVAGGVAAGLFLLNRRLGLIAVIAAVVMAFARVYVGAHYPGDVTAGLFIGAATTIALSRLAARILQPILTALTRTPLRPILMSAADVGSPDREARRSGSQPA